MLKRRFGPLLLILLLFLMISEPSNYYTPNRRSIEEAKSDIKSQAKYTYISYMCADNNLETYGKADVNEMEAGFNDSVTDIHVIALLDIMNGGTTAYYISHDDNLNTITSTILNVDGLASEENLGDPNTLFIFVNWCMTYYPADWYVLDLWNHGSGWEICFDDSSGKDALTMNELRGVLDAINTTTGNIIDILCMDACLMGTLEVAYELHDYVSILVASEDTISAMGFPYNDIINDLCNNPGQNITKFASTMVNLFYFSMLLTSSTLSAVNLSLIETQLFPCFVTFAENLHEYLNYGIKNELYNARSASQEFYYPEFIDLYDFTQKTKKETSNNTIQQLAQNLMDNITSTIINEKHTQNPNAYGLSIYFPELQSSYISEYSTSFSLSNDTMWDEFLTKYYMSSNFGLGLWYYSINDSLGDNNGTPDPNETILIDITLKNIGDIEARFVNGTLICLDTENVTIQDEFKNYKNISIGTSGVQQFKFNISADCVKYHVLLFIIMTEAIFNNYSIVRNFTFELIVGLKITLGGDSLQSAKEITKGYIYGILPGPGDNRETWLKINCTEDFYLFLNLTGPDLTDFDIYIYGPNEILVSIAGKANYPDECSFFLLYNGYYYIEISPFSGFGYYTLFVNITTEAYEDGSFFGLAYTLPITSTTNGTLPGPAATGYFYYRIIVYENQQLTVNLEGPAQTDFDLYIYNPNLKLIASSKGATSIESCRLIADLTGYFYIVIVPYDGSGEFTLKVRVKNISFPSWLLILLISLVILSGVIAIVYYFTIIRKSRNLTLTEDVYNIRF
ncbi:MAG: clostripain-related cysteine peptidase [Promethearchaeota archaeon]